MNIEIDMTSEVFKRTNIADSDEYRNDRKDKEKYFIPENKAEGEKTHMSPSGKYKLVVTSYKTRPGCWNYSRGEVYRGEEKIADVKRNYGCFPFRFAEGHANGHDYLLCGEDYQGLTVIELDTGKRSDFFPKDALKGFGFCHVDWHVSPDSKRVATEGCFWACPYDIVVYDFSEPLNLPWPIEQWLDECDHVVDDFKEDGLYVHSVEDCRKSDGKLYRDMTDEERKEVNDDTKLLGDAVTYWRVDRNGEKTFIRSEIQ